jgi:hypothetical protein
MPLLAKPVNSEAAMSPTWFLTLAPKSPYLSLPYTKLPPSTDRFILPGKGPSLSERDKYIGQKED